MFGGTRGGGEVWVWGGVRKGVGVGVGVGVGGGGVMVHKSLKSEM